MSEPYGYQPPPQCKGVPAWAWALVGCGCLCVIVPVILAAMLYPVFMQARGSAGAVSCVSNVKQQGLAMMMYAQDYDEKFPRAAEWMDLTIPYVKNEEVYQCFAVVNKGPAAYGYAFNSALSTKLQSKIQSPMTTVMLYDSSNLARNATDEAASMPNPPRHGAKGNVIGYADGHAKLDGGSGPGAGAQ